jgi:preprotein translocase subunit SecY
MFRKIIDAFKTKEVRVKILITLALLLVFRIGCWLPIPGIDVSTFQSMTDNSFLSLLSSINGGSLANGAFLALGVSPYITASIIIQLLTIAIPSWQKLSKEGEEGRKKISKYTKYAALVLAIAQAIGIVVGFGSTITSGTLWAGSPDWITKLLVISMLVAGAMFTVWLGEKITQQGIGNGLSLLIFVGILSSAGMSLLATIQSIAVGNLDQLWNLLIFIVAVILIFALIVFVDLAERKVPVQYAKQIKGRKMYGGQSTNIPIRVNGSGVMPIIFASALLTFPQLVMSIFVPKSAAMTWYNANMGSGSWPYIVLTSILILFFAYFYSQITFNPDDISKQIQQNGGFIPGIRPGKPTAEYLKKISNRVILFGAIFLAFIALVPNLIFKGISGGNATLLNAFSATGLLIVVSVALEFDKQLEAQLLMKNYRGFLK